MSPSAEAPDRLVYGREELLASHACEEALVANGWESADQLVYVAATDPKEWRRMADEAGWPDSARPGMADLSPELQMHALAAAVGGTVTEDPLRRGALRPPRPHW